MELDKIIRCTDKTGVLILVEELHSSRLYVLDVPNILKKVFSENADIVDETEFEMPLTVTKYRHFKEMYLDFYEHNFKILPQKIEHRSTMNVLWVELSYISSPQLSLRPSTLINLIELNITNSPIKILPPGIKYLINLKIFHCQCCGLTDLPNEICEIETLETVNASQNSLTSLPSNCFRLKKLRCFILCNNNLSYLPENFKVDTLYNLDLRYNSFSTLPGEITHLQNIEMHLCARNSITSLEEHLLPERPWEQCLIDIRGNPLGFGDSITSPSSSKDCSPNYVDSDESSEDEDSESNYETDSSDSDEENQPFDIFSFTSKFLIG